MCACSAALFAAVVLFQAIVPSTIQNRYLAPALPPLAILAVLGVTWLRDRLGRRWVAPVCAAAIVATAAPWFVGLPVKQQFHLTEASKAVWANRLPDNPSVLIAMDGEAEGAAIAELAMYDPARPSLFAVRGSRLLGGGGYNASDYVPKFDSDAAVAAGIDDYAIPFVLLRFDATGNRWAHVGQVRRAQMAQPERWRQVYSYSDGNATVVLYRILGNDARSADIGRLRALSGPKALGDPKALGGG